MALGGCFGFFSFAFVRFEFLVGLLFCGFGFVLHPVDVFAVFGEFFAAERRAESVARAFLRVEADVDKCVVERAACP